jgi:hypothetical protein
LELNRIPSEFLKKSKEYDFANLPTNLNPYIIEYTSTWNDNLCTKKNVWDSVDVLISKGVWRYLQVCLIGMAL